MYGQIATLAFVGIEARPVDVQVRISGGQFDFAIVGLPDKAVAESRERVRNALHAMGLGLLSFLPSKSTLRRGLPPKGRF